MIVKLTKREAEYPDLTFGQPYAVIGIEADDYRILNDAGRPFLYPSSLFTRIDSQEPRSWVTEFGEDKERYSYPSALNRPGFFEDFFDEEPNTVATFWHLVNQGFPTAAHETRKELSQKFPSTTDSHLGVIDPDLSIYAGAGLALRWAQLFEAEIVTVLLIYGVSRQKFNVRSEAEEFLRKTERRPLGQLLREILTRVRFEPDVSPTFEAAISARNSLVHRFFWDRAETFAKESDHSKMLDELRDLTQLFFSAYTFAEMLRNLYLQQLDEDEMRKISSQVISPLRNDNECR
ncbi:MAG TPA: hypothetical protein VJT71_08010 [Pyrinomonadaceae bacterium]|nr:hypothetical protein [Pyrinomonadaceae bacterium]